MALLAKGMRMQVMNEASQTVSLKGSCCPLKPAGCNRNMAEVSRLYLEDKDNTREGQESWLEDKKSGLLDDVLEQSDPSLTFWLHFSQENYICYFI